MQFMTASLTLAQAHPCLTPDEIFGHFGQRRAAAQEKYRDFVQDGIGSRSIRQELEASFLGVEGFAEGLRHLLAKKQEVRRYRKGNDLPGGPLWRSYSDGELLIKLPGSINRESGRRVWLQPDGNGQLLDLHTRQSAE